MIDRLGGYFGSRDAEEDFDDDYVEESDAELDPPPSPVGQDERRMQVRAYNHWASLLGDLDFPHIADLHPEQLGDFGPYSVLLDLADNVDDPMVRFVGAELAYECDFDGGPARLSQVPGRSVLSRITDHYMQILANQAPIGFEAEFIDASGVPVLYRGILLPYSSNNQTIDFIYGVINWKEMADQQTADELLLAIDRSLGSAPDYGNTVETAETLTTNARAEYGEDVLELGNAEMMESHGHGALPQPAFGSLDDEPEEVAVEASARPAPSGPRLDALGNPLGGPIADDMGLDDDGPEFDNSIKTAADYGLPEWDEEEEGEDDVADVVNPLADEETSSSLISLVSRGERAKKSVDLTGDETAPPIPQAFHGNDAAFPPPMPTAYEAPAGHWLEPMAETDEGEPEEDDTEFAIVAGGEVDDFEPAFEDQPLYDEPDVPTAPLDEAIAYAAEEWPRDEGQAEAPVEEDRATPEGLYDSLAAAREMAQAAQSTEDRSRKTLYAAVGRAYDFSLEAQHNPAEFDELLASNSLTYQDRAPMTPVVKLVFGADYDKTRLTEYAAVLTHAHRVGVERGTLATFLREAEGGLKGIVNEERRLRKEEQGKPVDDKKAVRASLARKLRALDSLSLDELDEDGAEFALVMVRRTPDGDVEVIGEVPEDVPLVERAARKLLG